MNNKNFPIDKLKPISWLFKNLEFDKSTGTFNYETDLFTFLENINRFSYNDKTIYDDFYYILKYTEDSIKKIIENINYKIIRIHNKINISKAKEFDSKTISYLSKKPGRTLREKLSDNKILAVQREKFFDTPENRLFKKFLNNIVSLYHKREDLTEFQSLYRIINKWLKSDISLLINEKKSIIPNNVLLHHKEYHKIFKAYKWLGDYPDKINFYIQNSEKLKKYVLLFELFQQLQFYTSEIIIPQPMKVDMEKLKIITTKKVLLNSLKLNISDISEETNWNNIRNFITDLLITYGYEITKNKCFYMSKTEKAYINLFNLTPIFYAKKPQIINKNYIKRTRTRKKEKDKDNEYVLIQMPLTLKQKFDEMVVNCNGTKFINTNDDIYTLPDILNSFNLEVLSLFLKDFKKIFNEIYYIVPDFINAFEFSESKKTFIF